MTPPSRRLSVHALRGHVRGGGEACPTHASDPRSIPAPFDGRPPPPSASPDSHRFAPPARVILQSQCLRAQLTVRVAEDGDGPAHRDPGRVAVAASRRPHRRCGRDPHHPPRLIPSEAGEEPAVDHRQYATAGFHHGLACLHVDIGNGVAGACGVGGGATRVAFTCQVALSAAYWEVRFADSLLSGLAADRVLVFAVMHWEARLDTVCGGQPTGIRGMSGRAEEGRDDLMGGTGRRDPGIRVSATPSPTLSATLRMNPGSSPEHRHLCLHTTSAATRPRRASPPLEPDWSPPGGELCLYRDDV